jgi:hypothetical protein
MSERQEQPQEREDAPARVERAVERLEDFMAGGPLDALLPDEEAEVRGYLETVTRAASRAAQLEQALERADELARYADEVVATVKAAWPADAQLLAYRLRLYRTARQRGKDR